MAGEDSFPPSPLLQEQRGHLCRCSGRLDSASSYLLACYASESKELPVSYELLGRVSQCVCMCVWWGGQRLLKFNKASEKMRRRTCLPLGAELCGQVQIS